MRTFISAVHVAVTAEIQSEMEHISGELAAYIRKTKPSLILEVGDPTCDYQCHLKFVRKTVETYKSFIKEYNGGTNRTVGYKDVSIIALAKTLHVPLVSMEAPILVGQNASPNKRKFRTFVPTRKRLITHSLNSFVKKGFATEDFPKLRCAGQPRNPPEVDRHHKAAPLLI